MLKQGTQIIYVPTHANGNIHHPDCEAGFVAHETVLPGNAIFCRYWANGSVPLRLRTVANSEATSIEALVERDTVPQQDVTAAMVECGLDEVEPGRWFVSTTPEARAAKRKIKDKEALTRWNKNGP